MTEALARRRMRITRCVLAGLLLLFFAVVLVAIAPERAAAGDDDKTSPPAAGAEGGGEASKTSPITHFIKSMFKGFMGWTISIIFILISIGMVALIVVLLMDLRMSEAVNGSFVDDFTEMVNKRQFKQAYELCKNDNSFLARIMTSGMARLQYGIEDSREAMLAMVDTVKASKENLISYLATTGTLGPLLGLVGTVSGMVGAFRNLGEAKKGTVDTKGLAGEISHALVVTLVGVFLAVPAIFFFSFFKSRLSVIAMNTSNLADDLLTQMYHNSKKPAPASGERTASGSVPER